jgi:hypothetical protein
LIDHSKIISCVNSCMTMSPSPVYDHITLKTSENNTVPSVLLYAGLVHDDLISCYMPVIYILICRSYILLYVGLTYSSMSVLYTPICPCYILLVFLTFPTVKSRTLILSTFSSSRKTRWKSIIQVNWYFSSVVVSSWKGLYFTLYPVICRWYTFLYAGPTYSYMSVLHTLQCQSFILQYVHAIYCYMPIANPFILWYAGLVICLILFRHDIAEKLPNCR